MTLFPGAHLDIRFLKFFLVVLYSQKSFAVIDNYVSEPSDSGMLVTVITLGYMVILVVLSWINYDQRKVAENEFKLHRQQLERLIFQRTKELEIKNQELEKKIQEIKMLQNSIVSQKKLASLGKLSAGIAHEIKNPLNMINNSAKTIVQFIKEQLPNYIQIVSQCLEGNTKQYFVEDMNDIKIAGEIIISNGERANSIINNMLSQVSRGRPDLKLGSIEENINQSLNIVYHTMRALYPFNLEIQKQFESIPKVIFVYEDLGRAFINIFENSFYAMREKLRLFGDEYKPVLKVKLQSGDDKIIITIEDNGIGIKSENIDSVMEPFFSTKPPGEGTGLGLSMVNDIISAHGGEVKITSEYGKHTIIRLELPYHLKDAT